MQLQYGLFEQWHDLCQQLQPADLEPVWSGRHLRRRHRRMDVQLRHGLCVVGRNAAVVRQLQRVHVRQRQYRVQDRARQHLQRRGSSVDVLYLHLRRGVHRDRHDGVQRQERVLAQPLR